MKPKGLEETPDLRTALEDVHRIRELVDRTRGSHPIRQILRPLLIMSIIIGPIMAIYGIASQLILDAARVTIWGMSKTTFLWIMGGAMGLLIGSLKTMLPFATLPRGDQEYSRILKKIFTLDYGRIILPILSLAGAACLLAIQAGSPHQVFGLVTAAIGAIWIAAPLAFPLPEVSRGGVFLLIGGIVALFVWPEYPFFKLAAIWGLALVGIGLAGLRSSGKNDRGENG